MTAYDWFAFISVAIMAGSLALVIWKITSH
jgi:hypothetical protein